MTDKELLDEIKKKAKECSHADDACELIYFINNIVNPKGAYWRSWICEKHGFSGEGAVPTCPACCLELTAPKIM